MFSRRRKRLDEEHVDVAVSVEIAAGEAAPDLRRGKPAADQGAGLAEPALPLIEEELRRLRALGYVGGGTPARPATDNAANPATNATTNTNAPTGAGAGTAGDKKDGGQ